MDNIIAFPGPHSELFTRYVQYKRSLGYTISHSYQYVLCDIARVLAHEPIDPNIISQPVSEALTARRPDETVSNQCKRIAIPT